MPDYTNNFNLEKPLINEYYNVEVQNRNMDAIDTELNKIAQKISKSGDTMEGDLNTLNINMNGTSSLKHGETTIIDAGGKLWNAVYNDFAELFLKKDGEHLEPGDVLVWNGKNVEKSKCFKDKSVCGVYSDTYGFLLGGDRTEKIDDNLEKYVPVGLAGRVRVKVVGDVEVGDLLCSSKIEGVACKADDYVSGTIIGKALENKRDKDIDRVWMLVTNI